MYLRQNFKYQPPRIEERQGILFDNAYRRYGNVRGVYFPKKSTAEKIAQLAPGASIVCTGDFELFNGNISYSIKKIDYGAQPEGFVPEKLPGRKVPKGYHHVFPEPYEDYTQSGFFDDLELPADLKAQTFVVFDIETTGLNSSPASGKVDRIIEIGAVKMQGGNMTEKFSSFIACPEKLPPNIVELTGIHDEDLVSAPDIEDVLADFYKFTDGVRAGGAQRYVRLSFREVLRRRVPLLLRRENVRYDDDRAGSAARRSFQLQAEHAGGLLRYTFQSPPRVRRRAYHGEDFSKTCEKARRLAGTLIFTFVFILCAGKFSHGG